ncbi:hypothetical protein F5Y12DRAFT_712386 [Xylaria sp. FL1777]|nr:hypothetical protein F5Y12DRAFT_712386 [Xylaria sp. FL1777]
MEVETLLPQLQDTLSQIRSTISELSAKAQNDELGQLEQKRERLIAGLKSSFQKDKETLEAKRQRELEDIQKRRKQEDEERATQRQQEDDELNKAKAKEDRKRQQKHDREVDSVVDETERKMDEIEEVAQSMVEQGKKKMHDLDERRRELNHLIDEQLEQSLPTSPPRKRGRPKKEAGDLPKDGHNGEPASTGLQHNASSPKAANKPLTPSKPPPPPAVSSPEKSPDGKKDGELPFQDRTISYPQVAKDSANSLPRSFAEALKKDMSNGSKDKPESTESSEHDVVQQHFVRDGLRGALPNIKSGIVARSGETEPTKLGNITRDGQIVENVKPLPKEKSEVGKSTDQSVEDLSHKNPPTVQPIRSNGVQSIHSFEPKTTDVKQQNDIKFEEQVSGSQPLFTENHGQIISNVGRHREGTETQPLRDQPHIPDIDKTKIENCARNAMGDESPEELERAHMNNDAAAVRPKVEGYTVDSKATFRSPRLSSSSDKRNSGEGGWTHDQVQPERSTTSDLLKQKQSESDRGSSEGLTRSKTSRQPYPAAVEPDLLKQSSPTPDNLVLSLDGDVLDISPEPGTPVGFEHIQDSNSGFPHIVGQEERQSLASPLPVENETVSGQDQLFDENKTTSDLSDPSISEEEPDLSPNVPIDGQSLSVLTQPPSEQRPDDQGLTSLIGEFDNWAILTEQITERAHEVCCQSLLSRHSPFQDYNEPEQSNAQVKPRDNNSQNNSHGKPSSNVNMTSQPRHQGSSPASPPSPIHDTAPEVEHSQSPPNPPSQDTEHINDQMSSHSQFSPVEALCSNLFSGLAGSNSGKPDSSSHGATSNDREQLRRRSSSTGPHPKHSKQRGRPKHQSFQSPERALNPREHLFQSIDDDINIRTGWFRHSKRGLS